MAAHDHAGHDHAAELLAAGASQGGHDHGLPPGVVALEGAELVAACALAATEDPRGALDLRVAAIFIIAIGSALGVFLPLLLQRWRAFDKNRAPFFVLKAFGAGVILATGVVHMYPAASSALASPCLGWPEFPWAGVITTFGIIGFLLLEHGVTNLVDARLHAKLRALAARGVPPSSSPSKFSRNVSGSGTREKSSMSKLGGDDVESGKEALAAADAAQCPHTDACCPASSEAKLCGGSGDLSIVNVHGPALAHSHGHQHGRGSNEAEAGGAPAGASTSALATLPSAGGEDCDVACRHNALAQVLEFGIAMHSFIIGIALGVSRDPAEIKPLLVAITFHQCFEGIALGSCLIEAEYGAMTYAAMGAFYSLSTASGVAIGIGIAASYNPGSRAALGVSGVLDSISAAILIYAALVDLIAADFLTKRFRADKTLQVGGYCALLLGAGLMSLIAIWA